MTLMQIARLPTQDLRVIMKSRLPLYHIQKGIVNHVFLKEILDQIWYHLKPQNLLYKSRPGKYKY